MVRPKSVYPTDLELQILKILWDQAPLAVREVRESLDAKGRPLAHTTVITTLNVMVDKKYLKRSMQGNACFYEPVLQRENVNQQMLRDVMQKAFDGSAKALVLSLFESAELDPAELKELRQILNRKSKESK